MLNENRLCSSSERDSAVERARKHRSLPPNPTLSPRSWRTLLPSRSEGVGMETRRGEPPSDPTALFRAIVSKLRETRRGVHQHRGDDFGAVGRVARHPVPALRRADPAREDERSNPEPAMSHNTTCQPHSPVRFPTGTFPASPLPFSRRNSASRDSARSPTSTSCVA